MKTANYNFTAKDGTNFSFDSYTSFATWFFGVSRRVMQAAFDAPSFRAMNRMATSSVAARKRTA